LACTIPQLSAIVPVYNCVEKTQAMLVTLHQTIPEAAEVILIDDCSDLPTQRMLEEHVAKHRQCTLIRNEVNRGFAVSCNLGVARAQGNVLAFINNDLILSPGWLEPMLALLEAEPKAGLVGNVQYKAGTKRIDHAGMYFHLDGLPRQARKGCKEPPREPVRPWRCVSLACALIRRDILETIGGLDEGYRNGCEDADLCVRLTQAGYQNYVCNSSRIEHHVSSSPGRHRHNDTNVARFLDTWGEVTRRWGDEEWVQEYFHIYRRKPWKIEPRLWPKLLAAWLR